MFYVAGHIPYVLCLNQIEELQNPLEICGNLVYRHVGNLPIEMG